MNTFSIRKSTRVFVSSLSTRRERETDSESSRYETHTHTHARTSAAEALFCVGYLVFYNNAQREREREREISINEVKENV